MRRHVTWQAALLCTACLLAAWARAYFQFVNAKQDAGHAHLKDRETYKYR